VSARRRGARPGKRVGVSARGVSAFFVVLVVVVVVVVVQSVARSGQKSIAQGLPWEIPHPNLALTRNMVELRVT
jgi:hypothetical protein